MKLTKQQKQEQSKVLAEKIKLSPNLYLAGYQGLKFVELAVLRAQLRPLKGSCRVVKNSLLSHALEQAGIAVADEKLLDGPNAIVLAQGDDPVSPAKILAKFAKEFPNLKLKAGFIDARWMSAADCQRLAALGSKPELLAKLAGVLYSTVAQSAGVLAAPIRDLMLVLKAVEGQKKSAGAAA